MKQGKFFFFFLRGRDTGNEKVKTNKDRRKTRTYKDNSTLCIDKTE